MKAMVLHNVSDVKDRPLKFEEIETPKISDREILMKVETCGVCHSDICIIDGSVFKDYPLPMVVGHEVVGVVQEKGDGVEGFEIGDRIGIGWNYSACLDCGHCEKGNINLCSKKRACGVTDFGGYATHMKVDSRFVTKVPDKLSSVDAAPLFCGGLTSYRAVNRLDVKEGDKVVVVGIGGLAEYAIQFLKLKGAHVVAVSRKDNHLEAARKLGADETIKVTDDLSEKVKETGAMIAMVFAPSGRVLEETLSGLPRGSRVLMVANIEKMAAMNYRKAMAGEKTLTTTTTGTMKEMKDLLDLAADGKVKTFIETMKLEEANDALVKLENGEVEGRIVLTV